VELENAGVDFSGVDSNDPDDVGVAGGNGKIFHGTGEPDGRTTTDVGDVSLQAIEVEGDQGLAVGGGGEIYHYTGTGTRRTRRPARTSTTCCSALPSCP